MLYYRRNGRLYLLGDDVNHPPRRNTSDIWRLDADPDHVYFIPGGNGDSTHGDCIAVQGPVTNVLIARNWMETASGSGQALKLDDVGGQPEFITIENNVFISRTTAPTYLVLLQGGSNTVFRNNLIYPGPGAPLARGLRLLQDNAHPWENLQFYNNIISGAVVSSGTVTSDYNLWMSAPHAAFNAGAHTLIVSGLPGVGIVDETDLDFHLRGTSVARDAGDPGQAPGVTAAHPRGVDYDGIDRDVATDIGPYEYTP